MKRLILLFIFFILTIIVKAQLEEPFRKNYPDRKTSITLDGGYDAASNAITNSFASAYYFNEFINNELKDQVNERLGDNNQLGGDMDFSLNYRHFSDTLFGMSNAGFFAGLKTRNHVHTYFPGDLFRLFFYGNKQFEGKTINADDFEYEHLQYQQFELGLTKEFINGDRRITTALGLSALNGQSAYMWKSRKLNLTTGPDGEYLEAELDIDFRNTEDKKFGASNGLGASAFLYFSYAKEKSALTFEVKDLGFIRWNNNSSVLHGDTAYRFEGVELQNIYDTLSFGFSDSSLVFGTSLNRNNKEGFTTLLPAWMHLSYSRLMMNEKLLFTSRISYRINAVYFPLVSLRGDWYFTPKAAVGLGFRYGGYGRFNTGIHLQKDFGGGFIVLAGTNYIDGLIAPSKTTGQGAYFSVRKVF